MTEGNRKRLIRVAETLKELVKLTKPKSADISTLILLDCQEQLGVVMKDLVLRPEVNSGTIKEYARDKP